VGGHERQAAEQNVEALLRQPISVGSMERLIDALL
jgi:hypothetical protein